MYGIPYIPYSTVPRCASRTRTLGRLRLRFRRRGCARLWSLERSSKAQEVPTLSRSWPGRGQGLRRTQTWHEILPSRSRGAPFHSVQKSSPPRAKVHVPGSSKTKPPGGLTFASDGSRNLCRSLQRPQPLGPSRGRRETPRTPCPYNQTRDHTGDIGHPNWILDYLAPLLMGAAPAALMMDWAKTLSARV